MATIRLDRASRAAKAEVVFEAGLSVRCVPFLGTPMPRGVGYANRSDGTWRAQGRNPLDECRALLTAPQL